MILRFHPEGIDVDPPKSSLRCCHPAARSRVELYVRRPLGSPGTEVVTRSFGSGYSYLSELAGLATAARTAWKLTVIIAIIKAVARPSAKTIRLKCIR